MGKIFAAMVVAVGMLLVQGCSSNSNESPADIVLIGKVQATAATVSDGGQMAKAEGPITVTVQGHPHIQATVGSDGTFTLRGLPAGGFTLLFTQGGEPIGSMIFTEVAPNQQITITIQVVGGEAVLVDEDRRGIGHAGVELEGLVQNVITLNPTGDSTFVIAGRTVIARPGVTAIRKGSERLTVDDVKLGVRVHVKGATMEGSQDVLAYEIKIQQEDPGPGTGGGGTVDQKITICHIPPGKPDKKHTITVGTSAWPAHQAHGDTRGPC